LYEWYNLIARSPLHRDFNHPLERRSLFGYVMRTEASASRLKGETWMECATELLAEEVVNVKANLGTADRIIRVILGILIILVVRLVFHSWWGLLGIILILTAVIRWCPIYRIFGISTCPRESSSH